jgi:D-amino-acid dehydrogenase
VGQLTGNRFDVAVVGGGVQGLTSALELARTGRRVCVLDALDFTQGTSHGNAGLLCPSYVTPIASPRALVAALAWLVRREGPLTLSRRPWEPEMARWIARFLRACADARRVEATRLLARLARASVDWYDAFAAQGADFGFARAGWLYVYDTAVGLAEGMRHARSMAGAGVASHVLSAAEARELEPALREPIGAIHYPADAHLDPHAFIAAATHRAGAAGIELVGGAHVTAIVPHATSLTLVCNAGDVVASHVILAAGAHSAALAESLGSRLPILPARGHSATLKVEHAPRTPLLLAEAHIVLTPTAQRLRMTSGLELGSVDPQPDAAALSAMAAKVSRYIDADTPTVVDPWVGFRPLTPDGLPIVGALKRDARVIVTSGHGTLGMTLAPATAQVVREVVEGRPEPPLLSPKRFGV